jgi:xylulokinase
VTSAVAEALKGLNGSKIAALGVSGQQHGLVVLGEDGQVLRPAKLWCDTESAPEAQELSQKTGWHMVSPKAHVTPAQTY